MMDLEIEEWKKERHLLQAENAGRFSPQRTEFHFIKVISGGKSTYEVFGHDLDFSIEELPAELIPWCRTGSESHGSERQQISYLRCMFQRSRPRHISGSPDALPFSNIETARKLFQSFGLPASYLEIADGSSATVHAYTNYSTSHEATCFELIAHCVTKQGDWALALSHEKSTASTVAFWSVDDRVDSEALTEQLYAFRSYAFHPMLIPCIMLAATLRMAMQRRVSIKGRLDRIEKAVARITEDATTSAKIGQHQSEFNEEPDDLERLFGLLHGCKKDQASRKGRYDYWHSVNDAMVEGFKYAETALGLESNEERLKAHNDLKKWKSLTWQRLKSIMARDEDHNSRVDNISYMLYTLNQQRDIRLQSSIARASQRDSEDMKYIAVLGSIFLPASLVATILNVPEFQFLPGPQLFGAYIAITIPFIVIVLFLCFARRYQNVWGMRQLQALLSGRRSEENLHEDPRLRRDLPTRQSTMMSKMSRITTATSA